MESTLVKFIFENEVIREVFAVLNHFFEPNAVLFTIAKVAISHETPQQMLWDMDM